MNLLSHFLSDYCLYIIVIFGMSTSSYQHPGEILEVLSNLLVKVDKWLDGKAPSCSWTYKQVSEN
jgi:hypothetical protein